MALVSKSSFTYNVTHQLCSSKRGTAQDCQKVFLIYLYNPRCRRMDMMPQTRQQGRTQWFNMAERMVIMHIIKLQKHRLAIFWKRWTSSGSYLSYGTMTFFLLLPTAFIVRSYFKQSNTFLTNYSIMRNAVKDNELSLAAYELQRFCYKKNASKTSWFHLDLSLIDNFICNTFEMSH